MKKRKIAVCHGPTCSAQFAHDVKERIEAQFGNREDMEVCACSCTGHCALANNIMIDDEIVVSRNTPQNVVQNVEKALAGDIYGAGGGVEVDPWHLPDDEFLGVQDSN